MGVSADLDRLDNLDEVVRGLLNSKEAYGATIADVVKEYVYNPGRSGEACGKYITKQLEAKND